MNEFNFKTRISLEEKIFELMIVNCPICEKPVLWNKENLYRPFCCKNCQLIDLGQWINGEKYVSSPNNLIVDRDDWSKD